MKRKNSLYPYPVLGTGRKDYINSSFSSNIQNTIEFNSLKINVSFSLDDTVLLQKIKNGSAQYAIRIECSDTAFREFYCTSNNELTARISLKNLKNAVTIMPFVVAQKDIPQYRNPNFNKLYKDISININKGNILADGEGKQVYLEDNESAYNNSDSLFRVQKIKSNDIYIDVNFAHSEYVLICMGEKLYSQYISLSQNRFKETVCSLTMLPILITLLNTMAHDTTEHEDKIWFNIVKDKLTANGILLDDLSNQNGQKSALVVAQKIFDGPITRALNEIDKRMNNEE